MKKVDTHLHLWNQERFAYGWMKAIPALDRSFGLDEYLASAKEGGVEKAVFMECDVDPGQELEEARMAQVLVDAGGMVKGFVASAAVESDAFDRQFEAMRELPGLVGIRRVLHTRPSAFSRSERFRRNARRIGEERLVFDLCVLAGQLPVAFELAQACPGASFVLDHCGVPDVRGEKLDPWRKDVEALSELPNVVACKVSGLVAYADADNCGVPALEPWFRHVRDCFGWERLVWGSDWPVCTLTAGIAEWIRTSEALVSEASREEREKLFSVNAERIYGV